MFLNFVISLWWRLLVDPVLDMTTNDWAVGILETPPFLFRFIIYLCLPLLALSNKSYSIIIKQI